MAFIRKDGRCFLLSGRSGAKNTALEKKHFPLHRFRDIILML